MENPDMPVLIQDAVPRLPELRFASPVNWQIEAGQQWAVIGPNGAGKSLLTDMLQRKIALKEGCVTYGFERPAGNLIKSMAFKDIYSLTDCRNSYYQQRWHSTETDDIPTVEEFFSGHTGTPELQQLLILFGIEDLLPKRLIFLSSGELRKFLIVRMLLTRPHILILDNPFIGLDAASRSLLAEMFRRITQLKGLQLILLLSNPADIPDVVTHVLPVQERRCYPVCTREEFLADTDVQWRLFPSVENNIQLPVAGKENVTHEVTFRMEKVSIRYGERTILRELDWEVRNGEKWSLSGPNGSGKSTLLSLLYADNPQSYANTLYLFDRKRGTGESIWDIKKRIGYVSPEMHLYYMENVPAMEIVGSGFFDSVGLHRKCNAEQQVVALQWMEVFGIGHLKERLFLTLSSREQRLVLLARAFVKDPDLLILDEPLHGLDISNKNKVAAIIEQFCLLPGKTLIYVTHYVHELPPCIDRHYTLVKQT
ncbi:MAG: ATP-binding cassette domain-containing protein [Tannerellaceae bacterium]|nr:ATP-binding cassette domain-containing protein [Tannerellaceae bacterium]MCD8263577.1 ATP-binding cassette domain-containing protein [Tannerellaceae bacterium]